MDLPEEGRERAGGARRWFPGAGGDLGQSGRELLFQCGDGTSTFTEVGSLAINDTDWHFVSLVYGGQPDLRFGLDGVYETIPSPSPSGPSSEKVEPPRSTTLDRCSSAATRTPPATRTSSCRARSTVRITGPRSRPTSCSTGSRPTATVTASRSVRARDPGFRLQRQLHPGRLRPRPVPELDCKGRRDRLLSGRAHPLPVRRRRQRGHRVGRQLDLLAEPLRDHRRDRHHHRGRAAVRAQQQTRFIGVWSDPNGDGDPTDAQLLSSASRLMQLTEAWFQINVPDVVVGPPERRSSWAESCRPRTAGPAPSMPTPPRSDKLDRRAPPGLRSERPDRQRHRVLHHRGVLHRQLGPARDRHP